MKKLIFVLFILALASLACNLPAGLGPAAPADPAAAPEQPAGAPQEPAAGAQSQPTAAPAASPTPAPSPTPTPIPDRPVGISAGLASLDSYALSIMNRLQSNDPADFSETTIEIQQVRAQDAQVVHTSSLTGSAESSTPERSESFSYQIGLETCSLSEGEAEFNTLGALEKELASIFNRVIDFLPLVENPQYLGAETVNGIPSSHFTFQLSGLGSQSGADVTANQGEYWLAVDGQYLVKYSLVIELRTSPEQGMRQEYRLELTNANQPISITFPPACESARTAP